MGTLSHPPTPRVNLTDALFSGTQQRVLGWLFGQPSRSFYSKELIGLAGPGKPLKAEPPDAKEFAGLKRSGVARLTDAANATLAFESRFDLAYNAAHALSLAALRRHGYRSDNRYGKTRYAAARQWPMNGDFAVSNRDFSIPLRQQLLRSKSGPARWKTQ